MRRSRVCQELGPLGETLKSRVRGPVGIDIGAVTPEGIALAIISQIHAWLAGREVIESVHQDRRLDGGRRCSRGCLLSVVGVSFAYMRLGID